MWDDIGAAIGKTLKCDVTVDKIEPISGSDVTRAYCLHSGTQRYFVKLDNRDNLAMFEAEALNLDILNCRHDLIVPEVICFGITQQHSFLVTNYIAMHRSPTPQGTVNFAQLGEVLANLHSENQQPEFGWPEDNFIGATRQINTYDDSWARFFSEYRIKYQLQLFARKADGLNNDQICAMCRDILCDHQPIPSLVHGDLWSGNIGFTAEYPCLFDPACYYGDREVDIAMSELFGRFDDAFYQSYHAIAPLDSGYEQRKLVYNFYHILNHANMFGGVYVDQVFTFIKQIQKLNN
ncbi:fructosamine kinase family protein [Thalassotalea ponticola]|uniref:fructosamine kinase family protein n=1 Tax=Thalassotalea ponticola TaxID=1523392 RepID=UPI0025B2FB00|nr:fructosamine kinase family protein [Thalassotalea ponticola]MDN3651229.1 fructosamine kinase family protein [Thalassotalea ponticola]